MKAASLKLLFLFLAIFTLSCATRSSKVITMKTYLPVENGETREEILKKFGEPISITVDDDGVEIFKYIERFSLYGEVMESRTYFFYIKNGKVIHKMAKVTDRPSTIDSDQL